MLRALTSLTFVYVPREDRILAAINAGGADTWSCWLTRRLVLAVLERTTVYPAQRSDLAQRAPAELRGEAIKFEQEVAIAKTAPSMSTTPSAVLETFLASAQLADRLTISPQGSDFRLELRGPGDDGAAAAFKRAELQRMLQMLQVEASRAGWLGAPAKPQPEPAPAAPAAKPARH